LIYRILLLFLIKKNGVNQHNSIPFNNFRKFLDMNEITKINPALKRSGDKNSYILIIC
tara:strand:+ start:4534 stop:4707 length:174 start_codon:yes stop_codon:yes gene_type:complete